MSGTIGQPSPERPKSIAQPSAPANIPPPTSPPPVAPAANTASSSPPGVTQPPAAINVAATASAASPAKAPSAMKPYVAKPGADALERSKKQLEKAIAANVRAESKETYEEALKDEDLNAKQLQYARKNPSPRNPASKLIYKHEGFEASFDQVQKGKQRISEHLASEKVQAASGEDPQFPGKSEHYNLSCGVEVFSTIGGSRREMEDTHIVQETKYGIVCTVNDGHGGAKAAEYIRDNFVSSFEAALDAKGEPLDYEKTTNTLVEVIDTLHKAMCEEQARTGKKGYGGSCIVGAFIPNSKITQQLGIEQSAITFNVGDSQALKVEKDGKVVPLSEPAIPMEKRFEKAVKKQEGEVRGNRVGGELAVARALGDADIKGVVHRPKITTIPFVDGKLYLGCDGLNEGATNTKLGNAIANGKSAKDLVFAAAVVSEDNLTCMIIDAPLPPLERLKKNMAQHIHYYNNATHEKLFNMNTDGIWLAKPNYEDSSSQNPTSIEIWQMKEGKIIKCKATPTTDPERGVGFTVEEFEKVEKVEDVEKVEKGASTPTFYPASSMQNLFQTLKLEEWNDLYYIEM